MNKRGFLLFMALMVTLGLWAKTLKVYSVTGNVSQKSGTTWSPLAKSAQVSDGVTIKINPASQVRFMDSSSHQIYTFSQSGEFKLADLIAKSDKDNKSLTGKISAESKKQLAASSTKSHQAVGAAHRATLDEEVLEALYAALAGGFEEGASFGDLSVKKVPQEDGLYYLSLTNNSADPMFVNIFVKNEGSPWQAIYKGSGDESAILLTPESTVDVDYILMADEEGGKVAAVGFNQLFEAEELNDMFEGEFEPQDTKAENVSIFFIP